jgi:hypothetical protein
MVINDVPKGIGFTVEECIIEELSGGIAGIDAGGGVSVYGLQVLRNTFVGPSANQSTAAVKLNGRAGPPTNPEESFCQDALITGNNFKPIQVPDDQNPGQFILHPNPISIAAESVPKNNEIYDNRGSDIDTRLFDVQLAPGAALANLVDGSLTTLKLAERAISEVYYASATFTAGSGSRTATYSNASIRPMAKCLVIAIYDSDQVADAQSLAGETLTVSYNPGGGYNVLKSMALNFMETRTGTQYKPLQTVCMDVVQPNTSTTANSNISFRGQFSKGTGTVHLWVVELAR